MVIQRSWKILSDSGSTSASSTEANRSPPSSSDDSNCSNQTTHSMALSGAASPAATISNKMMNESAPSDAHIKYVTTPQMAESMLQRLRQRNIINNGTEPAMRSLELVRICVQQSFDKEINEIMQRFMENYFRPAFGNIKENLGQNAVNEEMLQKMSCALLENAKSQYNTIRKRNLLPMTEDFRIARKRPATKPVVELRSKQFSATAGTLLQADAIVSQPIKLLTKPQEQQQQQQTQQSTQQPHSCSSTQITTTTTMATSSSATTSTSSSQATNATTPHMRRQIFWNTAHISTNTKFVLDLQANISFGFGTDGKERLASKHPELIRYLPDAEDRDWLARQSIIQQQNRSSRFLFLIHEEVCSLQTHELYKNKPNIDLALMQTFTVPDFMIQKMKLFFVDLNIKSRGLITNSFSIGNALQGSNSHLRNLLQGVQSNTNAGAGTSGVAAGVSETVVSGGGDRDCNAGSGAATLQTVRIASTLSSSHATLTALLSGGSTTKDNNEMRNRFLDN